nr:hypothetical protein CFP56_56982 [Quercus suber]
MKAKMTPPVGPVSSHCLLVFYRRAEKQIYDRGWSCVHFYEPGVGIACSAMFSRRTFLPEGLESRKDCRRIRVAAQHMRAKCAEHSWVALSSTLERDQACPALCKTRFQTPHGFKCAPPKPNRCGRAWSAFLSFNTHFHLDTGFSPGCAAVAYHRGSQSSAHRTHLHVRQGMATD